MDSSNTNRPLSEISHLFLSNVRDLPRPGAPRPQRIPPGGPRIESAPKPQTPVSDDLSPEEYAQVFGRVDLDGEDHVARRPIVTAVLAAHLSGGPAERVKEYARHYAADTGFRVGLIEVDASEFRLMCFEPGVESHAEADDGAEGAPFDARHMAEMIDELNVDVDRWLLHVVNPRLPEARALLRSVGHWLMLSTCDHDGVVSCYRTLKGLSDLHRPRLSLALLDAPNSAEAVVIHRKLASVCEQFLHWRLEQQTTVEPAGSVSELIVLHCRPLRDKAQLAAAPQWQIVADFLANAQAEPAAIDHVHEKITTEQETAALIADEPASHVEEEMNLKSPSPSAFDLPPAYMPEPISDPARSAFAKPQAAVASSVSHAAPSLSLPIDAASDVVDLPSMDASPSMILSAIIRHQPGMLVECPVRPPMCEGATLAVDREHGLVLLAVANAGLADFRSIAQAYQWLSQNRSLIGMAVPQFSIDTHRLPQLRLLVDYRDMTADLLQPMLEAGHVTVQAYRKLRWGEKSGLLLEAA